MRDSDCVRFLQWALPRLGLRWEGFRKVRRQVCRRVQRRVIHLGLSGVDAYRHRLEHDPGEWEALDLLCRATVSRFFRDRSVWDVLGREILPVASLPDRPVVRAWSAGCASGEEPYSLSILWRLRVAPRRPEAELEVVATDRDPVLLERAEEAAYGQGTLKEVPERWLDVAFERAPGRGSEETRLRLRRPFRAGMRFSESDVRADSPTGPFALVFCRNLAFTYFDVPVQRRVLESLLESLVPGGHLVLGSHESLPPGEWPLAPLRRERRILRRA